MKNIHYQIKKKMKIDFFFSKFFGDSEKQIHEIFEEAKKMQPCVIFFDDLHLICKKEVLFKS